MIVSADQRRAHSRAIQARAKWRVRYSALVSAIRLAKARINAANRNNSFDRESEVQLKAMRYMAVVMMSERFWIKEDLRDTAYTYADRAELLAA
jgi:hypothetical protein